MSPRTRSLRLLVTFLAACLLLTGWSPAEAATTTQTTTTHVPSRTADVRVDHAGSGEGTAQRRSPAHRASRLWRGRRISYYDALPAKWHWSAATAVAQWNALGGGIRFVRTTRRAQAQLIIGYGRIGSAAGRATIGRTRHAWVRLSVGYVGSDALDARTRVEVMDVITHELGHVLGFAHTSARCSLMSPVLDVDGCGVVTPTRPGYYRCRTIDARLVARFTGLYGGRARPPVSRWCLLDRLPSALSGVKVDGTSTPEVTVSWNGPASAPAGSRVAIRHWTDDACAAAPSWTAPEYALPSAREWRDTSGSIGDDNCVQVQLVNRYGAGRSASTARIDRPAPAPAPAPASDGAGPTS